MAVIHNFNYSLLFYHDYHIRESDGFANGSRIQKSDKYTMKKAKLDGNRSFYTELSPLHSET